ncbi:cell division protein SepF [Kovacikia minuta CCNUW1]|uniref:cell division protein SepF n=1 Tax=Kovacikia minuta TaxID=2931930 RepID=UPI001CC98EC2|nr:cell division protein SepF [Kovacikia minuta]UBF24643.1 cell division protein SepF [Kovacikia minuta CCNUW1]
MNIFRRMWDTVGLGDRFDDEYEYEYEEELPEGFYASNGNYPAEQRPTPPSNVVGMPNRNLGHTEMCLMEPRTFEEMPQAVIALRERKSIILSLGLMDPDTAQRCVDFVAGAAFAVDGHQERLGEHIFLFTPSFVQISSYPSASTDTARSPVPPPTQINPPAPNWNGDKSRIVQ